MKGDLVLAAGRVRSKKKNEKKTRKSAASKTHHKIRSSRATVTTSRRRAMKYVPRVSPCSPAPVDPWFVEIGLVQLSPSVKTTNVTQTDRQTSFTSREVNEARRPHICSRLCAFEEKKNRKKTHGKSDRTQNTPRNPRPGDRDHLETVYDETGPTAKASPLGYW